MLPGGSIRGLDAIMKDWIPMLVASLSGLLSFLATLVAVRSARSIEKLKAQLSSEEADRAARRDYEYEALKRLYAEFEPMRFQLVEASESAVSFTEALARRLRQDEIPGSFPGGTYQRLAIIYNLLLPAACFRILGRRLTLIDLELSPPIHLQYLIAKEVYLSFARDAEIARIAGLVYTPYVQDWRQKRETNPHRYRRQGFALGRLDNALDQLIGTLGERERLLSFGEFEAKIGVISERTRAEHSVDHSSPLGAAVDLFAEFDIDKRPVLWRVLLVQYFLYRMLLTVSREPDSSVVDLHLLLRDAADLDVLDIGQSSAKLAPVDSARQYVLRQVLPQIEARIAKTRVRAGG